MQITEVSVVFFEHVETHLSVRIWYVFEICQVFDIWMISVEQSTSSICKNSSQMFSLLYAFITLWMHDKVSMLYNLIEVSL